MIVYGINTTSKLMRDRQADLLFAIDKLNNLYPKLDKALPGFLSNYSNKGIRMFSIPNTGWNFKIHDRSSNTIFDWFTIYLRWEIGVYPVNKTGNPVLQIVRGNDISRIDAQEYPNIQLFPESLSPYLWKEIRFGFQYLIYIVDYPHFFNWDEINEWNIQP